MRRKDLDEIISLRISGADRIRLRHVAKLMGDAAGGAKIAEAEAVRTALARGIAELTRELGGRAKR